MADYYKFNWKRAYCAAAFVVPMLLEGCPKDALPAEAFFAADPGEMKSGEKEVTDIGVDESSYDGENVVDTIVEKSSESEVGVIEEMPRAAEVNVEISAEIGAQDSALEDLVVNPIKPYTTDANCVALFHFDGAAPFEDSCHGLKLNNYNTSEAGSLNGFGTARVFDGKAYMELPDSSLLKVKTELTLEALVKPTLPEKSYVGKKGTIVTKEDFYEGYFLNIEDGKITGGAMLSDGKIHTVASAYVLPTDTFTHLALTYDGAKMRLYVNHKKVAEDAAQGTIVYKTNKSVFIGLNAYENGFKGAIDEVRISDVAREF